MNPSPFSWLHCAACGILVPLQWKPKVLTAGPPRKSPTGTLKTSHLKNHRLQVHVPVQLQEQPPNTGTHRAVRAPRVPLSAHSASVVSSSSLGQCFLSAVSLYCSLKGRDCQAQLEKEKWGWGVKHLHPTGKAQPPVAVGHTFGHSFPAGSR